jgi:hypothetical protein
MEFHQQGFQKTLVHGTDPQFLIEKIIRERIYECRYWTTRHSIGIGDRVIMLKSKQTFSKGYAPKYSGAVYTVVGGNGDSFSIADDNCNVLGPSFSGVYFLELVV